MLYFPKVKGGKDLYLPLHHKLVELYTIYLKEHYFDESPYVFPSKRIKSQPVSASDVRMKLSRMIREAGISKKITPHGIRHSTATHLTIKKVDQRSIASILGHSDLRSTIRYQHLSIEHLREPLNVLV